MNTYIKLPFLNVQHMARRKMARITQARAQAWRKKIDELNAQRARRWFGPRKPLSDRAAKEALLNLLCFPCPDFLHDAEFERARQLLQLTLETTPDGLIYLSCDDYSLLR